MLLLLREVDWSSIGIRAWIVLAKFKAQNANHTPAIPSIVSRARPNIKTVFPWYGDSRAEDKTVVGPSYLKHGHPYTGKTTSLYWDGPQLKNCSWKNRNFFRWNNSLPCFDSKPRPPEYIRIAPITELRKWEKIQFMMQDTGSDDMNISFEKVTTGNFLRWKMPHHCWDSNPRHPDYE